MINDLGNKASKDHNHDDKYYALNNNIYINKNGNSVDICANAEGGNIRLTRANGCHIKIDTCNMNGSSGMARLYMGDSSNEAKKSFCFNENGVFGAEDFRSVSTTLELENSFSYRTAKNNGYINDALLIDTSLNINTSIHKPHLVHKDKTKNLPGDCNRGVRLVFPTDGSVFVVIIGCDSNSHNAIYLAMYTNGFGWLDTWRKLS